MATDKPTRTRVALPIDTKEETVNMTQLQKENNDEVNVKERKRSTLSKVYAGQERVMVSGAPMYQAYFGRIMTISINGVFISVPLDGNRYSIPKTFAKVFLARIKSVNEQLNMQRALSNVTSNGEKYPGQLDLISRA